MLTMSLDSALSIASGGLANINAQFALISQNVANAATPGYAVEVGNQQDVTSDGFRWACIRLRRRCRSTKLCKRP